MDLISDIVMAVGKNNGENPHLIYRKWGCCCCCCCCRQKKHSSSGKEEKEEEERKLCFSRWATLNSFNILTFYATSGISLAVGVAAQ